jgi:hypothetical protein
LLYEDTDEPVPPVVDVPSVEFVLPVSEDVLNEPLDELTLAVTSKLVVSVELVSELYLVLEDGLVPSP